MIIPREIILYFSDFGMLRLRKRTSYPRTFAEVKGDQLHIGYGSPQEGFAASRQRLQDIPESMFYGKEFLYIVADCHTQEVIIQRDALSTLPLFAGAQNERLVLSNHFERAYDLLDQNQCTTDRLTLAKLLLSERSYNETLVHEIKVLHDRCRAKWSSAGYHLTLPPDGNIVAVAAHRNGSGKIFRQQLEMTLDGYWARYMGDNNTVACELSCGYDTSAINGYHASKGYSFTSVSLMYPDAYGESFRSRLRDFATRFSSKNHVLPLEVKLDYPLAGMAESDRWRPFYHWQDLYDEPLRKVGSFLEAGGVTAIFRGLGGDELFENLPELLEASPQEERRQEVLKKVHGRPAYLTDTFASDFTRYFEEQSTLPPVPTLSYSVTAGAASGNNAYIDYGIWPVLPLADPELYLYCQSLPIRYRAGRRLMRAYLEARDFPPSIYDPLINEDFSPFFNKSTRMSLYKPFIQFMRHSVLAEWGFLDKDIAISKWTAAMSNTGREAHDMFPLYCLLCAEINLQTMFLDNEITAGSPPNG